MDKFVVNALSKNIWANGKKAESILWAVQIDLQNMSTKQKREGTWLEMLW